MKIMMEATEVLVQRYVKGIQSIFLFDSWFYSKRSAESLINVMADMMGMVRTNKKYYARITLRI